MFAPDQERTAAELFGPEVTITAPRRSFLWRFPSAEHQAEFFAAFHGPARRALTTLGAGRAADLKADMLAAVRRFDVSDDDTLVLRMDYLEAVISKPATP
jgi:hypothetical protein